MISCSKNPQTTTPDIISSSAWDQLRNPPPPNKQSPVPKYFHDFSPTTQQSVNELPHRGAAISLNNTDPPKSKISSRALSYSKGNFSRSAGITLTGVVFSMHARNFNARRDGSIFSPVRVIQFWRLGTCAEVNSGFSHELRTQLHKWAWMMVS